MRKLLKLQASSIQFKMMTIQNDDTGVPTRTSLLTLCSEVNETNLTINIGMHDQQHTHGLSELPVLNSSFIAVQYGLTPCDILGERIIGNPNLKKNCNYISKPELFLREQYVYYQIRFP
jgi:hypothetical protein